MDSASLVRHSRVPFDEDAKHELKAHRSFDSEDVNPNFTHAGRNKRSSVSRSFCGMLNTGQGGSLFLGVTDGGKVEGFMMSPDQRDHFRLTVKETLSRYTPPVPEHMYSIRFVPVIDEGLEYKQTYNNYLPVSKKVSPPHCLRTYKFCWCDYSAMAAFGLGKLQPFFVIVIDICKWDPDNPMNQALKTPGKPHLYPAFTAEDGNCYIRFNASTRTMTMEDVAKATEAILNCN